MAIGAAAAAPLNNGRFFITLKPRERARRLGATQVIARLRPQAREGRGRARCSCRRRRTSTSAAGRAHAVPIHAAGRQPRRAQRVGAEDPGEAARRCRSCATSPPTSRPRGTTLTLDHRPRPGRALRHHAAADRRHALRRLRPAPGRAVLHAAEQLPRGPGGPARAAGRARQRSTRSTSARRPRASRCRWRPSPNGRRAPIAAAVDQPPGPVPGGHHQLQPRARRGARHRPPTAIQQARARDRRAGVADRHASRATRRRSRHRCARVPLLILAALVVVYLILGMLYESYIHPLTILSTLPSAGRRRAR